MLVYYFVPFIVSNRYLLFRVSNGHNSVTVQNRIHVYMNFFDHKDLGNHLLQLCPKVVKHPVCDYVEQALSSFLYSNKKYVIWDKTIQPALMKYYSGNKSTNKSIWGSKVYVGQQHRTQS